MLHCETFASPSSKVAAQRPLVLPPEAVRCSGEPPAASEARRDAAEWLLGSVTDAVGAAEVEVAVKERGPVERVSWETSDSVTVWACVSMVPRLELDSTWGPLSSLWYRLGRWPAGSTSPSSSPSSDGGTVRAAVDRVE